MPSRKTEESLLLRLPSGERLPLRGLIPIGSAIENAVRLSDALVSRRHCLIDCGDGAIRVRDLGSTNGTFVNGLRVTSAELHAGTTLEVGESRLSIVAMRRATELDDRLLGTSAKMVALRNEILTLAPIRLTTLIHGETGTGKELVARALHDLSGRSGQFVALNCGAIARELIESELFGHERGAFTGAGSRRSGLFEEARRGTLFLDEIGELPLELQPRLLRVLETGVVRPVGSNREIAVDVRVIAATHVRLARAVAEGKFRQDLFFRLSGAEIRIAPLRERMEDLPLLAERFLVEECASDGLRRFSLNAERALSRYPWPGNVRELRNVIRRAAALGGKILHERDLQLRDAPEIPTEAQHVRIDGRGLDEIEQEIFARVLERSKGSRRGAAKLLGIPKSTLCDKVKRYRIDAVIPRPAQAPAVRADPPQALQAQEPAPWAPRAPREEA